MKAMILAAGFGTRLRPLTYKTPKPMFPVLNRPLLEHSIDMVRQCGIRDIAINVHHLPDVIIDHFGDGSAFGVNIHWSREEAILGTAGGIKRAQGFLDGDSFLVINSDVLSDIDLKAVIEDHREKKSALTLVLREGDSPEACDPIEMDDNRRIVHMPGVPSKDLPDTDFQYTFTGIQVMEPEIFDRIPDNKFYGTTTDVFPGMIEDGLPVYGYIHDGYWNDLGKPKAYIQAHKDILDGKMPLNIPPSGNPGKATIIPPMFIGKGCTIADTAQVGPYAVLGDGCVLEENAVVENSVLWERVTLKPKSVVSNSIIAEGAQVDPDIKLMDKLYS